MPVSIDLDDPYSIRTNHDIVSGHVNLYVKTAIKVFTIFIKLKGESRSQIVPSSNSNAARGRPVIESHKILYQSQKLFPEDRLGLFLHPPRKLKAGRHKFKFNFQIPLETDCKDQRQVLPDINYDLVSSREDVQCDHIKQILPPSLIGLPGLAEINYYIKVTVRCSPIFRDSLRSIFRFRFLPLTPPGITRSENIFTATRIPFKFQEKIISNTKDLNKSEREATDITPIGELLVRFPQPAILISSEHLPLELSIRKLNKCSKQLFLVSFSLHIISQVKAIANRMEKINSSTWVFANLCGLSIEIGSVNDNENTECFISQNLWCHLQIPSNIGPSFQTCNISRSYELDIRVGLGFGTTKNIQPQTIFLSLRLPIEIYSGVPRSTIRDFITSPATVLATPQSMLTLENDTPPPSYESSFATY
ncbi:hypothetical protein HI914_01351 [Erysiphe necator]|uniref:Putative e set n=1 Tax=Uncinula necator TaxID=52586 RepID=A0A0B1P824_UNCNE|nr:hypothetical protein HI914_01351 [Erysiphe necator]KHJ32779.1 putative e set [Erysiphe necator]